MTTLTGFNLELAETRRELGSHWGWFTGLGIGLIVLGVLAFLNLPAATTVSVYAVGVFMLIAAGAEVGGAMFVRTWSGFALMLVSALLYGAAGVVTIANPDLAAKVLTLMLAFALVFSGVMRVWWSTALRALPGWGWITASGIVSILAGIVFIAEWPADTVFLLGMVLAFDLTFQGAMLAGMGFALKSLTR
ncbi:MAG TPA: HdeD family acid-resistance protein [Usitatibacter sp.]|nr:HdeD family acid-resistance protein [Usitatibacter sp.]